MSHSRWTLGPALAGILVSLTACAYQGRGGVEIGPANGAEKDPAAMSVRFDRVQTKRIGDVFVFTAYRKPVNDRRTDDTGFRDFRRDPVFTAPELRIAIDTAGRVVEGPWLALRQGERVLIDGNLEGPVNIESQSNGTMLVTGQGLRWVPSGDSLGPPDGPPRVVSFDLVAPDILVPAPAPSPAAVSAATP